MSAPAKRRALRAAGLSLSAAAVLWPAHAAPARPDTRAMTCTQAQRFVQERGAVVMTTGRHTYERIVTGVGFCQSDEETWIKVAPTRDDPSCRVGYYCRTRIIEPFPRLLFGR